MNVSKILLNGVEYNLTDNDAQSKINEINESLSNVNESLKDYAKSEDVAANYQPKGDYLTEHQSLDNYYTKEQVDEAIDAIPSYDDTALSGRVADLEAIDHSKYLTEHQNISNLATKAEVKEVADKVDAIEVPTKVSELTNDSKYQTEAQVNAAIQKVVGAAPEALDTLEEIAEKLGDNDDVVAGLVTTISGKADKADTYNKSQIDEIVTTVNTQLNSKLPIESFNEWSETVATKEEVSGKADASALNNYYSKTEVESKIADAVTGGVESIDLTVYETKEDATEKYQPKGNYLTEHQSLADYVKKAAFAVNGETLEITFN